MPARDPFGAEIETLLPILTGDAEEPAKIAAANRYFLERVPAPDAQAQVAASVVQLAASDLAIHSTRALALRAGLSERSLQRLFSGYVGATPKGVIRRFRLHELVERLHAGEAMNFAALAQELGYFDQAHLIGDFRRFTGSTPELYRRQRGGRS